MSSPSANDPPASTGAGTIGSVELLAAAPWLAAGIPATELVEVKGALVVPTSTHAAGPWHWRRSHPAVGLLVLSGRMARVLHVDRTPARGVELVGESDLLRPWSFQDATLSIPAQVEWIVLDDLRIAALDREFVRAGRRWPQLWINLLDSGVERTRTLLYYLAARQVARLELRILLTLWHLADRWGTVGAEGVVLEMPKLTHELIARIVSARRPSVTSAIRHLRELGAIETRKRGRWVLLGDPLESLQRVGDALPPGA